ncbi:hypothetical protein PLICRDRAFT_53962 [Plicaturopsis crispa FD-325 SS-3]|nr:hypothetical protein PLICRDRAFT_53962 [Plicaturopsis crispa FD-325 SS-3]
MLGVPVPEIVEFGPAVNTKCSHIAPDTAYFTLNARNLDEGSTERNYEASVLADLLRFGYDVDKLYGANIRSIPNMMTFEWNAHDVFSQLKLWFEATDTPHCYRPQVYDEIYIGYTERENPSRSPHPIRRTSHSPPRSARKWRTIPARTGTCTTWSARECWRRMGARRRLCATRWRAWWRRCGTPKRCA